MSLATALWKHRGEVATGGRREVAQSPVTPHRHVTGAHVICPSPPAPQTTSFSRISRRRPSPPPPLLSVIRRDNAALRQREKDAAELRSLLEQKREVSEKLARGAEAARERAERAESEAEKMRNEGLSLR